MPPNDDPTLLERRLDAAPDLVGFAIPEAARAAVLANLAAALALAQTVPGGDETAAPVFRP